MIKINFNDKNYPQRLLKISKVPDKLYVEGNVELLNSLGIAVIGTRHPTNYGKRMCKYFTKELVRYGITIISGMAQGIDSIAHKTCLENGGKTIAVLPNGFNHIFPKQNLNLFKDIINSEGCAVTEYEKGIKPDSNKFLERNRIVAGLSIGTLVIEGGHRSGTSVTARITKEQEKPVFSVPSSLENRMGITTNQIIKEGAKLVTCVEDIIETFPNLNFKKTQNLEVDKLIDEEYLDVYNVLTNEPQHIDVIAKKTNLNIQDVSYKLMILELEETIEELPGKFFIKRQVENV